MPIRCRGEGGIPHLHLDDFVTALQPGPVAIAGHEDRSQVLQRTLEAVLDDFIGHLAKRLRLRQIMPVPVGWHCVYIYIYIYMYTVYIYI